MEQNDGAYKWTQVKLLQIEALYKNGLPLNACCKTAGISVHTYYKWRREGVQLESGQERRVGT